MRIVAGGIRRAFTLLEVLVALALMVLLGALTLPAISGFTDTANLSTTASLVESAVRAAASIAQDRGEVVELVARQAAEGSCQLVVRPVREAQADNDGSAPDSSAGPTDHDGDRDARGSAGRSTPGAGTRNGPSAAEGAAPVWSEILAALPPGFRLRTSTPTPPPRAGGLPAEASTSDEPSNDDTAIVLAVFLPDGSILQSFDLYLGDSSHWLLGEVSRMTARVRFEPYTPPASESPVAEDEKPAPDGSATTPTPGEPRRGEEEPTPDPKERPDDADPRGPS